MNSDCLGKVVAAITLLITVAVFGVGLYILGTSALIGFVTDNLLCCLGAIAALVGFGFLFHLLRNVFFKS
jgi:hypothetical protein